MVDIQEVRANLRPGQLVITDQTFKRSVTFKRADLSGECWYRGVKYHHDWLLTYGHKQYELLTPVKPRANPVYTRNWRWYCFNCGWKAILRRFPAKDTRKCPQCGKLARVREA